MGERSTWIGMIDAVGDTTIVNVGNGTVTSNTGVWCVAGTTILQKIARKERGVVRL